MHPSRLIYSCAHDLEISSGHIKTKDANPRYHYNKAIKKINTQPSAMNSLIYFLFQTPIFSPYLHLLIRQMLPFRYIKPTSWKLAKNFFRHLNLCSNYLLTRYTKSFQKLRQFTYRSVHKDRFCLLARILSTEWCA